MDLLDLILVGIILAWAHSGYLRGTKWVACSVGGLCLGGILGALLAAPLAVRIAGNGFTHAQLRAGIATGILLLLVIGMQSLGVFLGYKWGQRTPKMAISQGEKIGGAGMGVLGVLIGAWFLGLVFADSRFVIIDQQIASSRLITALTNMVPPPPFGLATLKLALSDPNGESGVFGQSVISQQPIPMPFNPVPKELAAAENQVVKVASQGSDCGDDSGSGWPIANKWIVTDAHVVAGGKMITVIDKNGTERTAVVTYFDPQADVAMLYVAKGNFTPLVISSVTPIPGTIGGVAGYPGGGALTVSPAAVRGTEKAIEPTIYRDGTVVRALEVLAANILPGDSGGPFLDQNGVVIGMAEATSNLNGNEGYALAVSEFSGDLQDGQQATGSVSTGRCING